MPAPSLWRLFDSLEMLASAVELTGGFTCRNAAAVVTRVESHFSGMKLHIT